MQTKLEWNILPTATAFERRHCFHPITQNPLTIKGDKRQWADRLCSTQIYMTRCMPIQKKYTIINILVFGHRGVGVLFLRLNCGENLFGPRTWKWRRSELHFYLVGEIDLSSAISPTRCLYTEEFQLQQRAVQCKIQRISVIISLNVLP